MLCPCCGRTAEDLRQGCECGARAVADPQTDEIFAIPRVGRPLAGLSLALLGLGCVLTKWMFIPAAAAAYFSYTALRQIRSDRERFGGHRMAMAGAALSTVVVVLMIGVFGLKISWWIDGEHEARQAATRSRMMELAIALDSYKKKHQTLPSQLNDLRSEGLLSGAAADYWEKTLTYKPTGQIASTATTVPTFTQYRLTSAGPDGAFGTADDIVLNDSVFTSSTTETASAR
jgi:Domain of unknown function (DUF4190)